MVESKRASHKKHHVEPSRPFVFLHVGDLHITEMPTGRCPGETERPSAPAAPGSPAEPDARLGRAQRLEADLRDIFADIESIACRDCFDFVYLPGDLAENGCPGEYELLSGVLNDHQDLFVRLIPGDHDRARGTLEAFARFRGSLTADKHVHPQPKCGHYEVPLKDCPVPPNPCREEIEQFYFCKDFNGVRCFFLDMVSASMTQKVVPELDFRLGASQLEWFGRKLEKAKHAGRRCAVFMHCYPADMRNADEATNVAGLIWSYGVKLVEMGHTHYNKICHDGRTQYGTARSLGQNEDGPAGYAVVALDGDVTSWRFRQLQLTWPFVMITSPADRRLATAPLGCAIDQASDGRRRINVRALVLSNRQPEECLCYCRVDDGRWLPMHPISGTCMFELLVDWPEGSKRVSAMAQDGRKSFNDFVDVDTIEPVAADFEPEVPSKRLGSNAFAVGVWHEKGVRGDRLGPNTSGHKW